MAHPAGISHEYESAAADAADPDLVCTSNWNETHHVELPVVFDTLNFEDGRIYSSNAGGAIDFTNDDGDSAITLGDLIILKDFNHSAAGQVGFYGSALVDQQTVTDLDALATAVDAAPTGSDSVDLAALSTVLSDFKDSVDAELAKVRTTVNAIIDALQAYGLLS